MQAGEAEMTRREGTRAAAAGDFSLSLSLAQSDTCTPVPSHAYHDQAKGRPQQPRRRQSRHRLLGAVTRGRADGVGGGGDDESC